MKTKGLLHYVVQVEEPIPTYYIEREQEVAAVWLEGKRRQSIHFYTDLWPVSTLLVVNDIRTFFLLLLFSSTNQK